MIARSPLNVIDFHRPLFFLYFSFFFITFFLLGTFAYLEVGPTSSSTFRGFSEIWKTNKQMRFTRSGEADPMFLEQFWNAGGAWLVNSVESRPRECRAKKKKVVPVPEWVCSTTSRAETAASIRQWSTRPRPDRTAETSVPGQPKSASGAVSVPKPALERRGGGPEETNAEPSKSRWQWSVSFSPIPFFFFFPQSFQLFFFFSLKENFGKSATSPGWRYGISRRLRSCDRRRDYRIFSVPFELLPSWPLPFTLFEWVLLGFTGFCQG